jgi:SulP family sulfate permease
VLKLECGFINLIEALVGYNRERLFKDVAAGITVGVVALPLGKEIGVRTKLIYLFGF